MIQRLFRNKIFIEVIEKIKSKKWGKKCLLIQHLFRNKNSIEATGKMKSKI